MLMSLAKYPTTWNAILVLIKMEHVRLWMTCGDHMFVQSCRPLPEWLLKPYVLRLSGVNKTTLFSMMRI